MKLTTKLLILTLLAMSFFMTERNIIQSDTNFIIISEEDPDYKPDNNKKPITPHSLDNTTTM